jgi:hypothetical protein
MNQILDPNGPILPILVAAAIGFFAWWFRKQGAPASSVDPFDSLANSMLEIAKRRLDQAQKDQYKTAAVEAIEKVMPAEPAKK